MKKRTKIILIVLVVLFLNITAGVWYAYSKIDNTIEELVESEEFAKFMEEDLFSKLENIESEEIIQDELQDKPSEEKTEQEPEKADPKPNTNETIKTQPNTIIKVNKDNKTINPTPTSSVKKVKQKKEESSIENNIAKSNKGLYDKISTSDKNRAIQIIYGSLSKGEISYLTSMVKDGITSSEITEAKRVLKKALTKDQVEELRQMYYKYKNLI